MTVLCIFIWWEHWQVF